MKIPFYILIILSAFSSCKRGCNSGSIEEPYVITQFLSRDSCLSRYDDLYLCYKPTLIHYDEYKALNLENIVSLNEVQGDYYFPINMNEDIVEYYLIDNYPKKIDTIRIEYEREVFNVSKNCEASFYIKNISVKSSFDSVRLGDDYYDKNTIYIYLD